MKKTIVTAILSMIVFTLICGVLYTGVVTGISQLIFPKQANGSIIEIDGKKYG
ncbi:MAG: potassium-transporting ATPase subunit C, partial [Oscillospiraceae bacterium]